MNWVNGSSYLHNGVVLLAYVEEFNKVEDIFFDIYNNRWFINTGLCESLLGKKDSKWLQVLVFKWQVILRILWWILWWYLGAWAVVWLLQVQIKSVCPLVELHNKSYHRSLAGLSMSTCVCRGNELIFFILSTTIASPPYATNSLWILGMILIIILFFHAHLLLSVCPCVNRGRSWLGSLTSWTSKTECLPR